MCIYVQETDGQGVWPGNKVKSSLVPRRPRPPGEGASGALI